MTIAMPVDSQEVHVFQGEELFFDKAYAPRDPVVLRQELMDPLFPDGKQWSGSTTFVEKKGRELVVAKSFAKSSPGTVGW